MFKPRSTDHPSSSPTLLDQGDGRITKSGNNNTTTDENVRMNSGNSGRRKESTPQSSSSSSKQRHSSKKSGEGERSKARGDRERNAASSSSRRGGGDGAAERQRRPSPEASRGGNQSSMPLQSSRGTRGGGRDGGREGKAERGTLVPPPPSSTSNSRDRTGRGKYSMDDANSPSAASSSAFPDVFSSSSTFSPRNGFGEGVPGREERRGAGHIIDDDSLQIDHLPMADLMNYLQLVANNSSNLPLTRRDDPELGRTVSSLTPEEYATKCAAFVPSMVRILGGQYGKYGSVWDLKTSEDFDLMASTREPGISHGGATCNALLKAMYDTESEVNNINSPTNKVDANDLFDDDDDETVGTSGFTADETLHSFDTLVLNDGCNSTAMTWAQLLRKMKPEIQGVGFNQVPAITSSYRLDLNEPFTLVPPHFKKGINQKRALLIGCNYRNAPTVELNACHDDVRSMKDFLVNVYGFSESPDSMMVLMDDKKHKHPTYRNITNAFKTLAEKSQSGDAVFVLFSGHGCRVLDSPIDETAESYDEALIPSDYEASGIIRDTLFFKTLLAPMKKGVMVTCLTDCCHTGVMLDLPYLWTTKGDKGEQLPKMSLNNDFSFVRFLKVVKTLYESSVFTRIGKTVGNELDKQVPLKDDDTQIETVDSLETMPEIEQSNMKLSFFDKLCSPAMLAQNIINCTLQGPDEYSDDEGGSHVGRMNSMTDDQSSCYTYS